MINYLSLERILQYSFCLSCIIINNNNFKDKGIIFLSSGSHYFISKIPISNYEYIIFNRWQKSPSRIIIFINAQDTQKYLLKECNIFIKHPVCLETLFLINKGKTLNQLKYKYKKVKSFHQAFIISKKMFITFKNNISYSNFYNLVKLNHIESYLTRNLINININGFYINYINLVIELKEQKIKLIQFIIYIVFHFKINRVSYLKKNIFYFIEKLDFSLIIQMHKLFSKNMYIFNILNIYIFFFDTLKMFVKQILININYTNNRIHSFFCSKISKTGRISSHIPNLQSVTKYMCIRKYFTIIKEKKIIIADYSSYEIRIIAALSSDKNLIELLQKKDFYSSLAFSIFTKKVNRIYNKHLRNKTKIILLGILYGMQHNTLANFINTSANNSHKLIHKYLTKYTYFFTYMQKLIELIKKENFFQNILGRKLIISLDDDDNINRIFNTARNMPIQSIAADIIKKAMFKIYLILSSKYNNAFIINTVHDELVIECFSKDKYNIVSIIEYEMKHSFYNILSQSISKIKININNKWQ